MWVGRLERRILAVGLATLLLLTSGLPASCPSGRGSAVGDHVHHLKAQRSQAEGFGRRSCRPPSFPFPILYLSLLHYIDPPQSNKNTKKDLRVLGRGRVRDLDHLHFFFCVCGW